MPGDCSLRDALVFAEAGDTVRFSPTVFTTAVPGVIAVSADASLLPFPTVRQGDLTIDGTLGAVVIDGTAAAAGSDGLRVTSDGNIIRGLVIRDFDGDGIHVTGASNILGSCADAADGNRLQTNGGFGLALIGAGADHNRILRNDVTANGAGGITVGDAAGGANDSELGCAAAFAGMPLLVRNNAADGVVIRGATTSGVVFRQVAVTGNGDHGILVDGGASDVSDGAASEPLRVDGNGGDGLRVIAGERVRFGLRFGSSAVP